MSDEKPPSEFSKFLYALVPLGLGLWMVAKPHLMDGYEAHGRKVLYKKLLAWIWGYPGGITLLIIGLLMLVTAFSGGRGGQRG